LRSSNCLFFLQALFCCETVPLLCLSQEGCFICFILLHFETDCFLLVFFVLYFLETVLLYLLSLCPDLDHRFGSLLRLFRLLLLAFFLRIFKGHHRARRFIHRVFFMYRFGAKYRYVSAFYVLASLYKRRSERISMAGGFVEHIIHILTSLNRDFKAQFNVVLLTDVTQVFCFECLLFQVFLVGNKNRNTVSRHVIEQLQ